MPVKDINLPVSLWFRAVKNGLRSRCCLSVSRVVKNGHRYRFCCSEFLGGTMHLFRKYAYLFIAPALLMLAVFSLYPLLQSIFISFHRLDLHENVMRFTGLSNYVSLIHDKRVLLALYHTLLFASVSVALEMVWGLVLALVLQQSFRGVGLARAAVMIPWAMPAVVVALLWRWMFNEQYGFVNMLLVKTGMVSFPLPFLSSPLFASVAVIVCDVWKTTPFMAILLLAGLQSIPRELYESAMVDGASALQRFRYITLPLLKPAILVALLFRTMDALRMFDTVYVLTGGGPGNATETLSVYAYKTMFSYLDFGAGSALAVVTFLTVMVVSIVYVVLLRRQNE